MLKKKEVFIQETISMCGACSIASIISHYGGYVPLETIVEDTFTDKNGTNAYEIVQALNKYGFISYGMKTKLSKINTFPVIAHISKNGLEHFLVIYNIDQNKVLTMDPECGKKIYQIQEFENYFTNNVIVCHPTDNIIYCEKNNEFKNQIKNGIVKHKFVVILFIVSSAILIFLNIFYSFYLKLAHLNNNLIQITMFFIIILNFKTIISYYINYLQIKLITSIDELLNNQFLNHIFNLRIMTLYNKRSGDIIKKIQDMNIVKEYILNILLFFIPNFILCLLGIIILILFNLKMGIVFLIFSIIYATTSILISKKLYRHNLDNNQFHLNYMNILTENINGITTIKSLNAVNYFKNKINKVYKEYLADTCSLSKNINKINNVKWLIKDCSILIINFIGICTSKTNVNVIIDLFTFNSLFNIIYDALENTLAIYPNYLRFKAVFRGVREFLDIRKEKDGEMLLEGFKELKIENLAYSYDHYQNTLKNFNLKIFRGEKILVTGPSGIGKSTLAKCICGICDTYNGSIQYNGKEIKKIPTSELRKNILYIGQDEYVFATSIKENIVLDKTDSFEEIITICKIDEIINKKSQKEKQLVLEGASNLSKGEKARIVLGRTLYLNPDILIIDETLSNLSETMENEILENLLQKEELTLIYITHRNKKHYFKKEIKFREDGKYEIRDE